MQNAALPIYVLILLMVYCAPYLSRAFAASNRAEVSDVDLVPLLIFGGAIILTIGRLDRFLPWTILLLIPFARQGSWTLIGGAAALMMFDSAVWWQTEISWWKVIAFAGIVMAVAPLYRVDPMQPLPTEASPLSTPAKTGALLAAFVGLGIMMGLFTGTLNSWSAGQTAWHHWGAFVSPVESWLAGGVPFRDFPVQYGIGPTALIAGTCGDNCWRATYWVTVLMNAAQFAALMWCVLLLTEGQARRFRLLAALAMFCAAYLWTGFAQDWANSVFTPSVSGIRFLPATALLLHILLCEHRGQNRDWRGHLIWLIAMIWSMESAGFASLLWWPYLALRASAGIENRAALFKTVVAYALIGLGAVLAVAGAMLLAYRAAYGFWIDGESFFAFLNNVPLSLPVNPTGPIWLALAIISIAMLAALRLGGSQKGRQVFACLALLMATGSYYVSRSHDNNVLNLFPFLILVVLSVLAAKASDAQDRESQFFSGFARAFLASMIAFVSLFQFESWKESVQAGAVADVGPESLIARFEGRNSHANKIIANDATVAIDAIRATSPDHILLFDKDKVMISQKPGTTWTGANNLAITWLLPDDQIDKLVAQGAKSYRRPGWIVASKEFADLAKPYFNHYDVIEERTYGSYVAYHLKPR